MRIQTMFDNDQSRCMRWDKTVISRDCKKSIYIQYTIARVGEAQRLFLSMSRSGVALWLPRIIYGRSNSSVISLNIVRGRERETFEYNDRYSTKPQRTITINAQQLVFDAAY